MTRIFSVFCFLALVAGGQVYGQQKVSHYQLPVPAGQIAPTDPDLKNLVWNKWDTDNFTILSLDQSQGKYLHENIESMKVWVLRRWGLPEKFRFSAECKVMCVPTKELMKKLFRLEQSHAEVRMENGNIKESVLWLVLDKPIPAEIIPSALTVVCLREFEVVQKKSIGFWAHRGMSVLNGTPEQIEIVLGIPTLTNKTYSSKTLFEMTEEKWLKLSADKKASYDRVVTALCLLVRKEFGQDNYWNLAVTKGSEQNLNNTLGFLSYSEFDATLKRYVNNLSNDIMIGNRTPTRYLQINPPERK